LFIAETDNVYHHQQVVASFANYMKDAVSVVKQYDYSGKCCEIQLPAVGTAGGFGGKKDKHYITPLLITQRQEQSILILTASQLYMRSQS
jgi:hypothetical protein